MGWTTLKERLDITTTTIPVVLAGPMLRKVTGKSVTVWLALRVAEEVTLTVENDEKKPVVAGTAKTIAIGKNLHIVAVTANRFVSPETELKEGIVYRYDVQFKNLNMKLAEATKKADLGYPINSNSLPSFAIPPTDPNLLRLLNGSCRMPHASGKDTFPIVDKLIAETASNAFARPHQLLLAGDQIYADDVADTLLMMLTDAADTLLGWNETLPVAGGVLLPAASLNPFLRLRLLSDEGFTSEDLRCHLLSLGEYLCMYLFTWSPVLWSPSPPTADEALKRLPFDEAVSEVGLKAFNLPTAISSQTAALAEFRKTLPEVRRALANIPSYMIFDDHEVTDDWNMTLDMSRAQHKGPLGRRLLQNALVAYALCQHWGNVPEEFESKSEQVPPPGRALLGLLDTPPPESFNQKASLYNQRSEVIFGLVGLQDESTIKKFKAASHPPYSLQYHFSVEGEGHQILFTDTRTWRSFPKGGGEAAELLPKDQFKRQILDAPATRDRVLLVVLSTNSPPTQPIRSAAEHSIIANGAEHYPDIYEAWDFPTVAFDRLLTSLTEKLPLEKLPLNPSGHQHYGRVILLSGDVHHSFATRLVYRAKERFEFPRPPAGATAVVAQLVASSFKKQTGRTIGFHGEGYRFAPFGTQWLIPENLTEGHIGWNVPADSALEVGTQIKSPKGVGNASMKLLEFDRRKKPTKPTTVKITKPSPNGDELRTELSQAPDYRYRLDYLLPTLQQVEIVPPKILIPTLGATTEQRKQAAIAHKAAFKSLLAFNLVNPPTVVGRNNFGEITFDWGAGDNKNVALTLRWWDVDNVLVKLTTFKVSLNPNDMDPSGKPNFPDHKAERGDP